MLVSERFTKVVTQQTRERLDSALDNTQPIARRERCRGAVVAVQSAISDLNRGYLEPEQVDGFFGSQTAAAVEAFQRDYGLAADGVVGRQTLLELDQLYASDLFREPQGMSIHVGVNRVDTSHYGNITTLTGCVNDANAFARVARSLGYNEVIMLDEEATTENFLAAMNQAAINLFAGDYLFVTFAGHGSQITNVSLDQEDDGLDETLCFYDRMLVDDEVYNMLGRLRPGVNVTVVYDSCHSATVSRALLQEPPPAPRMEQARKEDVRRAMRRVADVYDPELPVTASDDDGADTGRFIPIQTEDLQRALDGERPRLSTRSPMSEAAIDDLVGLVEELECARVGGESRLLPNGQGIYERNAQLYDAVRAQIADRESDALDCFVVALSASQDNQTTLDGAINGLYTGNILAAWNDGQFRGSVSAFHRRLLRDSPDVVTPALHTYGGPRASARLHERPFAF